MDNNPSIVMTGEVVYVESSGSSDFGNEVHGGRIKVRLDSDGDRDTSELPWAFPLLPKVFQSIPKVGEGVFVITSSAGEVDSQRYFIGPIISQPQFFEKSVYDKNRGDATSLLSVSKPLVRKPLKSIDNNKELTKGAFPEAEDVAILGRGQEDIILKYRNAKSGYESEINLRAGIRKQPATDENNYIKGNVIFNSDAPGYIQVKHNQNGLSGQKPGSGDLLEDKYEGPAKRRAQSLVNVVADKINLISHEDSHQFGEKIADNKDLINPDEMDEIMSSLHRAVYGDELIKLLKMIVNALAYHTHPYSMKPPIVGNTQLENLVEYPFENLISPNVRIS